MKNKWEKIELGNISEKIDYGFTASSGNSGVKFLRITDIQNEGVNWDTVPFCECNKIEKYALNSGDIVFARTGATTGKSFLINDCPKNAVYASYLIRLRPNKNYVDAKFLSYFFKSKTYWNQITISSSGATLPGVNSSKLKKIKIPLPPLSVQKQIAEILDTADALRRHTQAQLDALDELGEAVFLEMFGDVTNGKIVKLEIYSEIQGGLQVSHKRKPNPVEVPYLRVANVFRGGMDLTEIKTMRITENELKRTRLKKDDLLIVEGHGNKNEIGRSAIWHGKIDDCIHQNHLIRVRLNQNKLLPIYTDFFINSELGKNQIQRLSNTTSGLNTISTRDVKSFQIPLPPLPLQTQFATIIENIEAQKAALKKALAESEDLFGGLLQGVFG